MRSTAPGYARIWQVLKPFHGDFRRYILGVVFRQALIVAGGYSLVWALGMALKHTGVPEWAFVAAFILFDAGFLSFDLGLNYLFSSRVSFPLFAHLRVSALGKVMQMPMAWHERKTSGALVGEVNNGVGKVVQTAEGLSRELAPALIQTAFSLVPLLLLSPWTSPPLFAALGIFLWLTMVENRKRQPHARARYRNYTRDFGLFAESVQSIQPVVQYGQTGRVMRRYRGVQQQIMHQGLTEMRIGNWFGIRKNMVFSVAKRACQGVWLWQFRRGKLDPAMVMYLNMLTEQLLASFSGYASLIERIFDGLEPARRLLKLLHEKPAIGDDPEAVPVRLPPEAGIRLQSVCFGYDRGKPVLRDFNLRVDPGEILAIVGRSGCGKTTILNLLSRMYDVQEGAILLCGKDIRKWPLEQARSVFSFVPQGGGAFFSSATIRDVIRFGRPEAKFREVVQAARAAAIHADVACMPRKYQTRIGQGGATLSKGQQQRLALAQALVALGEDRKILVLDEFTSALDSETEQRILDNIQPYLAGRTVIIIAHRLSTIRKIAGRIVVLDEQGIAEQGTHEELVRRGGWYADMARLQAVAPNLEFDALSLR